MIRVVDDPGPITFADADGELIGIEGGSRSEGEDIPAGVAAAAAWLQLAIPAEALAAHAQQAGSVHAKATHMAFSPEHRAQESARAASQHAAALAGARTWLEHHVLPVMRDSAL